MKPGDGTLTIDEKSYAQRRIAATRPSQVSCIGDAADAICTVNQIVSVVVAAGKIHLLGEGKLIRLDSNGGSSIVARGGGGPGELRAPIAVGTGRDGSVSVFDIGKMRLIEFQEEAGPTEAVVFPPSNFRAAKVRSGNLFALALPPAAALGDTVEGAVLRFSAPDTAWTDTLARFAEPAVSVRGEGGAAMSRLPWDRIALWDACDDGEVVVGHSDAWSVTWYRGGMPAGRIHTVRRQDLEPVPMTDAEHDSISQDWLERSPKLPSFRAELSQRLSTKPRSRPRLSAMFCGEDNSAILVNTPEFGAASQIVDVLDREGRLLLSARVPVQVRIVGVNKGELLGVDQIDRTDVVYRIDLKDQ